MPPSQDQHRAEGQKADRWLTPECKRVQGELLDLASALDTAALPEYSSLVPSFLVALREFRRHLREHVASVEAPAGLFDYLAAGAPGLTPDLDGLRQEHCELDCCMGELERQLREFDPADPADAESIRQRARSLTDLTCCHQRGTCTLAHRAGGEETSGRR
jgi:hypothetical protein